MRRSLMLLSLAFTLVLALIVLAQVPAVASHLYQDDVYQELALLEEVRERNERQIELEREAVRVRQERLAELGWYEGPIDGIVGPLTRQARADFRDAADLETEGSYVHLAYVIAVFDDGAPKAPEPEPEPQPRAPVAQSEDEREVSGSDLPMSSESATTTGMWDRIAKCESGNNWSINTGNGYYGGLQFDKSSWDWAGGQQYAEYPHQATREQQIATAEKLRDMHPAGLGAWPACTKKLGLR